MARPRIHDLDLVLDATERRVAELGPGGVTVRSLAAVTGVSNGAIYHAFGSLPALLGRVWLRAATDFLDQQAALVEVALSSAGPQAEAAVDAVVAAADAPARFALRRPAAARMLMTVSREQLLGPQLPEELADELLALDKRLLALLSRLARGLWDRSDAPSVAVITLCVVDVPTAVFSRALTAPAAHRAAEGTALIDADSRERLEAAVRAVLAIPPPGCRDRTETTGPRPETTGHQP
ncbi:TetR/AcrR family transcriptional regulator [Actinomadura sp. 6N118]|uniref:TetR/AcrR family transcriptional regulator n=1 Tax=Actinomadura sp. 6N118 TaxID=3375151 RepID=UPI00378C9CE5